MTLSSSLHSPTDLWFRTNGNVPLAHLERFRQIEQDGHGPVYDWARGDEGEAVDSAAIVALWTALALEDARILVMSEDPDLSDCFMGFIKDNACSDAAIRAKMTERGPHRLTFGLSEVRRVRNNAPIERLQGYIADLVVILGAGTTSGPLANAIQALEDMVASENAKPDFKKVHLIRIW